jgi:hypothetical protein
VFNACPPVIHWCMNSLLKKKSSIWNHSFWFTALCSSSFSQKSFVIVQNSWQLHEPQTGDESWVHVFRPERQSASNVWATYQHTKTLKFMYTGTCGNIGAHSALLSPQLYWTIHRRAPQLAVSVITTFRVIWDQPSDQNAMDCAELLSCCCIQVCCLSGHILHTSVLSQWPHTAYQYVVKISTYCIPVCCWSMAYLWGTHGSY